MPCISQSTDVWTPEHRLTASSVACTGDVARCARGLLVSTEVTVKSQQRWRWHRSLSPSPCRLVVCAPRRALARSFTLDLGINPRVLPANTRRRRRDVVISSSSLFAAWTLLAAAAAHPNRRSLRAGGNEDATRAFWSQKPQGNSAVCARIGGRKGRSPVVASGLIRKQRRLSGIDRSRRASAILRRGLRLPPTTPSSTSRSNAQSQPHASPCAPA